MIWLIGGAAYLGLMILLGKVLKQSRIETFGPDGWHDEWTR